MITETPQMDWQQVALNGGPPCFAVNTPNDLPNRYCGRAEQWEGHGSIHDYVSLDDLLNAERERCAKIADGFADVVATEMMPTLIAQRNTATNIAAAIRGKD